MGGMVSADALISVCSHPPSGLDTDVDLCLRSLSDGRLINVETVNSLPSQTLRARYQLNTAENAPRDRQGRPLEFPESYRFQAKHSFKMLTTEGNQYLLQVAAAIDNRSPECITMDVDDCAAVRSLAHKFNTHLGEVIGSNIFVCEPIPVEITQSRLPAVLAVGDAALIIPYKACLSEIQKFVFNPQTDRMVDLPSAFFHYSLFITHGTRMVYDLQGEVDEDGDLYLVDPVVISANLDDTVMCGPLEAGNKGALTSYETLHPRCSPLCKEFDPAGKTKASFHRNTLFCGGCSA